MKPKRIILIRHGESQGNVDKTMTGKIPDYALLLTPKGMQQAANAGQILQDLVEEERLQFYVSPLFRTRQTFQQIIKKIPKEQYTSREEPRLREQEWGHIRSVEQYEDLNRERDGYGTFYFRIPGGESCADVYDRVSDFFNTLFRDFEKESFPPNAVMVMHGMSIRLFLMRWFHYTVEQFEAIANPLNCAMIVMELSENGKYELTTALGKHTVAHSWKLEN